MELLRVTYLVLGDEIVWTKYVAVGEGEQLSSWNLSLHDLAASTQCAVAAPIKLNIIVVK